MKAIVYEGAKHLEVKDVPIPVLPEGWGLVHVSHAGICGTDLNIYAGTHPRAKAPLVMGHEFSGTMASDVPGFPKGTRVTAYPLLSCGKCVPCLSGNSHVCNTLGLIGIDRDGGMAEYVAVPAENLVALPDDTSDKIGAFVEPVAVGVHTLRECGYHPGDNALVFGCGTIGLVHAITLRQFGALDIVMAEPDPIRAQIARDIGFEVINPTGDELRRIVEEKTQGNGFDWVLDCAGAQPVADRLFEMVKVKGHIIIVAGYKRPAQLPLIQGMFKETSIQFVRVYRKKDFEIASRITAENPDYEKIVTHALPVEEAQKGFDLLTTPGTGAVKVMFRFQ